MSLFHFVASIGFLFLMAFPAVGAVVCSKDAFVGKDSLVELRQSSLLKQNLDFFDGIGFTGMAVVPMKPLFSREVQGQILDVLSELRPRKSSTLEGEEPRHEIQSVSWGHGDRFREAYRTLGPDILEYLVDFTNATHQKVREAVPGTNIVIESVQIHTGVPFESFHRHPAHSITMVKTEKGKATLFGPENQWKLKGAEANDAYFITDQMHASPLEGNGRLVFVVSWVTKEKNQFRDPIWNEGPLPKFEDLIDRYVPKY